MRFCEKKKGGGTPFSQHKKRSTLDFLNFLCNQVRWSSLRGSKRLKKIIYERNRQKNMSLQDEKHITTQNSNFVSRTLSARQKPLDLLYLVVNHIFWTILSPPRQELIVKMFQNTYFSCFSGKKS